MITLRHHSTNSAIFKESLVFSFYFLIPGYKPQSPFFPLFFSSELTVDY